eukprot:69412_1
MSVEITESGKYKWQIKEALDKGKFDAVRFGRYVARFGMKQETKTSFKVDVIIKMKWECLRIPAVLDKDTRTLSLIFKLSKGTAIGRKSYKVTMFKKYTEIFHATITNHEINAKDMAFCMDWKMNVDSGFDKQQIQYDTKLLHYQEILFKNALQNGDIKIFYIVTNNENINNSNSNSKSMPRKKRKLDNDESALDEFGDEQKDNYVLMSRWLLATQSDYFKTYSNQKHFSDAGRIDFCGNKVELLAFIRFIITGVISVDVDPLRLCRIAGIYGVVRLQQALVIQIVSGLKVKNFVTTMNTLIKSDTIDNVYSEIVKFGVRKYKILKQRSDWAMLNGLVRNAIIMMYQQQNAK